MRVVRAQIIDPVCAFKYEPGDEIARPMGGSEATACRIARALGIPIHMEYEDGYDVSIVMRDPHALADVPGPKVLWMHDLMSEGDVDDAAREAVQSATVVGVSDFHKANLEEYLGVPATRIYNPVVAAKTGVWRDGRKIIYTSSPAKGLLRTLEVFGQLLQRDRRYRFYYANPGYLTGPNIQTKYVIPLNSLPHPNVLKQVESAALMLQCNVDFPETFGLVYGEARALETPVLTTDMGAAREVAGADSVMPQDATNTEWCDRIEAILNDPPKVSADPRFDLERIADEWRALLADVVNTCTISTPTSG